MMQRPSFGSAVSPVSPRNMSGRYSPVCAIEVSARQGQRENATPSGHRSSSICGIFSQGMTPGRSFTDFHFGMIRNVPSGFERPGT